MLARIAQFARSRYDRERTLAFLDFTWTRFLEDRCFQTAGAMAFTTVFALVPVSAAVLGIMAAFPGFESWREQLFAWIFTNFVPASGAAVMNYITEFAANASKATTIGILVLFFSALSLMMSIEDTFNRIFRVTVPRRAGARFLVYWASLTFGPLLLVAILALSSYAFALPFIDAGGAESLKTLLLTVLPVLLVFIATVSAYWLIPNRTVPLRHAVIGGLIATLLFEAAKFGFGYYVTRYATYQQIYGALATVPVLILWIYVSWAIVLFGASLTASLSSFDYRPAALKLQAGEEFAGLLRMLAHFASAQREGQGLTSLQMREREPFLTDDLLQRYLGDLHRVGLVQRGETGEWVVVRDLATITLADIYELGDYRLSLDPSRRMLEFDEPLGPLLDGLAEYLRARLALPLAEVFPLPACADDETHGSTAEFHAEA